MIHKSATPYLSNRALVVLTETIVADDVAQLRWEMHDLLLSGVRNVLVDASGINALSSTTLATLLTTHRACRARGGSVTIREPNARVLDLLRHTGLQHVFHLETSDLDKRHHSRPLHIYA